ncbi:hypothetical protein ACVGW8_18305, partial [Enterobacter hormaechei]
LYETGFVLRRPKVHLTDARAGIPDYEHYIERPPQKYLPPEGLEPPVPVAPKPVGKKMTIEFLCHVILHMQPGEDKNKDRVDFVFFSVFLKVCHPVSPVFF